MKLQKIYKPWLMGITILLFTPSAIIFLLRRVTLYMRHTCLRTNAIPRKYIRGGKAGEVFSFFFPTIPPNFFPAARFPSILHDTFPCRVHFFSGRVMLLLNEKRWMYVERHCFFFLLFSLFLVINYFLIKNTPSHSPPPLLVSSGCSILERSKVIWLR